jgi:hypothetical protein
MKDEDIVKLINKSVYNEAMPIFTDDNFDGVEAIKTILDNVKEAYDFVIEPIKLEIGYDNDGEPIVKRWLYSCINRWKVTKIPIIITIMVCGCGPKESKFSSYSVIAYAS